MPLSNFVPRGFGLVHHSIAILYHQVPNPNPHDSQLFHRCRLSTEAVSSIKGPGRSCETPTDTTNRDRAGASTGIRILPGVEALLRALAAEERVAVGLVTGNLEPIAWMKMTALGLQPFFSTPALGGCVEDNAQTFPSYVL